jgi:hexosaminidase
MRKYLLVFLCAVAMCAQAAVNEKPFVVPEIQQWKGAEGTFSLVSSTTVTFNDAALEPVAQYLVQGVSLGTKAQEGKRKPNGIHIQIEKNKKLGAEGYQLKITKDGIVLSAQNKTAALWGVQSILQLAKQSKEIPCGVAIDVPDYQYRGFMIDCGRKYIPLDYLRQLVHVMSYYKMNTLQVHLNDNGFKTYFNDDWNETYAGFRIQSELFPGLTSKDGFYTKDEFRRFIRDAAKEGVEIIPEIDAPAHALAFTHYRPSLSCEKYGADHLDLQNPAVVPFLDSLWSEYLAGPDPVFDCPKVHIGTDEYNNQDSTVVELFRKLTDHLIHTVEGYGKQAVLWGALTHAKGKTPVKSENVIMDMWYNGYADPKVMKEDGFKMVSVPDGYVYIVPEAGYYYNYLNDKMLYERWTPAQIGNQKFEERDPQIMGGMFALWNDVCGNGISIGDLHHRIFPAMQVISQKTWHAVNDTIGYANWDKQRRVLGEGPLSNELGNTEFSTANLLPGQSFAPASEMRQLGYDYQVDFDITWSDEKEGTVLMAGPRAKVYLSDPIGGWIGFSRDGYLFTFRYKGQPGVTEHITIKGTNKNTALYVNDKLVHDLKYGIGYKADKKTYRIVRTLVFPLQQTGDFKSKITQFKARKL